MNAYVELDLDTHTTCLEPCTRSARQLPRSILGGFALALALAVSAPPGVAQGFSPADMSVGQDPRDVVTADFNWDGVDDLAVANKSSNNISILWGYPGAVFAPAFSLPVASGPVAIVAADFSGDGIIDLATANSGNGTVSLARGKGNGTFYPAPSYPSGSLPRDLDAADIDGDGLVDLVVAHGDASASVTWLRSLGNGALEAPQLLASGFAASSVCVGDLDGIGGLDIVVGNLSDDSVVTMLGSGDGLFDLSQNLAAQAGPDAIRLVDLDGDDRLDILAANTLGDAISVFLNQGQEVGAGWHVPCGGSPISLAVGDVTGDEIVDLIVVSLADNAVTTVPGLSGGGFADPSSLGFGVGPVGLALADLDGDYLLDVITANGPDNGISILTNTAGAFIDLGDALVGGAGSFELMATGVPASGNMVSFTPRNGTITPEAGWLVVGVEKQSAPFQGGVMVPEPLIILPAAANVPLSFHWPNGMSAGSSVYLQAWFGLGSGDPSATNAVRGIVQAP